ncbi:hypothetical protein FACHB389_12490 [Nostoc calcicola FACHB-389]|nr:tetratricopeptide repeat protein [Nostoc calcicola FACHB-3891]OKH35470.1 hypothetical protein FACHB389_12490 [Nostoc calcicola FACHB-389]
MKGLKLAITLVVLGTSFYSAKADAQNFQNPNQLVAQVSTLQEKPQIRDSQLKPANTSGNSSSVETQLSQGYDLLKKDDYEGAIEAFNKVLQTERNNESATYAYFGRGIAYLYTEKYEAAKSDFDQVIALDAKFAHAYFFRAASQYKLGDKEAAVLDLNQAVSLFTEQGEPELAKKAQDMIENIQTS